MAYFGKEFKFDKEENFEPLIKALAAADEKALGYLSYKPNTTLLKNGDEYTLVISMPEKDFKKEIPFKSGVSFDETIMGNIPAKSVFTVEGDTLTQVQDFGKGKVTIKREFSATQIKVTITCSLWDSTAYRYYVPA